MKQGVAIGLVLLAGFAMAAAAQHGMASDQQTVEHNPSYDGRFTFVRLRQRNMLPDRPPKCNATEDGPAGWHHDHPRAERNLLQILAQITTIDGRVDSTAVLTADDPALMHYPLAYSAEAGCWQPTLAEVQGLQTYLQKGGFLLVDDLTFGGMNGSAEFYQKAAEIVTGLLRQVLPAGKLVPLAATDPAFRTFFPLDPDRIAGAWPDPTAPPVAFAGIYEENNPARRLQVLVIYNMSIGHWWRWSQQGFGPVSADNQSYKLGVNFILYGLTH